MALSLNASVLLLAALQICLLGTLADSIALADSPPPAKPQGASQLATQAKKTSGDGQSASQSGATYMSPKSSMVPSRESLRTSVGQIPSLSTAVFIENLGQFDSRVRYQVKLGAQTAWLTADGIVFDATRPASTEKVDVTSATPRGASSDLSGSSSSPNREKSQLPKFDRLVFTEDFVAATCCSKIEGSGPGLGVYNYIQDSDSTKWHTNIQGYSEVVYRDVWPSIDLRIYGNGPDLEQEFIVQPGGDLRQIQISYRGIDALETAKDGSLVVRTAFGTLRETKPRIYQEIAGKRRTVDGKFRLLSRTSYSFDVGPHSERFALVVDPPLLYSTFLGGTAGSNAYVSFGSQLVTGIAVDSSGNVYVAGNTAATDFPTTTGALQASPPSGSFITKMNATGSGLIYSTYLGSGTYITAIAVDSAGRAYVTGKTGNIPTTATAYVARYQGQCCSDFFLTELNSAGNQLIYSTYLGISNNASYASVYGFYPRAIAVDPNGRAYIAGGAGDGAPTTLSAYQPSFPGGTSAYLAVLDTTLSGSSSLIYATFLGPSSGNANALAYGVAVDSFGKIYLTGTATAGFPVTPGAFQTNPAPCIPNGNLCPASSNSFIAKLDPSVAGPQSLIYSTYFGGMGHTSASAIAVDSAGNAYVAGNTDGSYYQSFPVTPGAFQSTAGQNGSAGFVTKLNASGSKLVYSTLLAGNIYANGNSTGGIAVDSLGNAYVAGSFRAQTQSTFPVTPDAFQNSFSKLSGDYSEAFLTKLNPTGSALIYSSYLGGNGSDQANAVAIDQTGDAYVAGFTTSPNFPVTPAAFQQTLKFGGYVYPQAAFVTKFPLGSVQTLSISSLSPTSGGNTGAVTIAIVGGGFHNGASVRLVGGSTITSNAPAIGSEGRTITATFDITAAPIGPYALVVANPDNTTTSLPEAFTVLQGGGSNIGLSVTGLAVNHGTDTKSVSVTTISNKGNVDLSGGLLFLPINSSFSLTSSSPTGLVDLTQSSSSGFDVIVSAPTAPGSSQTVTTTQASTVLTSCDNPPLGAQACFFPITGTDPGKFANCLSNSSNWGKFFLTAGCTTAVLSCLAASAAVIPIVKCVISVGSCGYGAGKLVNQCLTEAQTYGPPVCFSDQLSCVYAIDPNALIGPAGIGGQRWVAGVPALTYVIEFENKPSAAVPAQQVIVTQPLGANVKLSDLRLLGITIPNGANDVHVNVPAASFNPSAGVTEFITNVDLRPTQNLLVNVDALLNPATQTLTWTLTSIDPATGQSPVNPLIGFLRPGATANLSFSVTPKQGLATGTQITEQASILFVGASPMSTAIWVNTIDNTAPVSHVSALQPASSCPVFRVSWAGSDVGSGLRGFAVFASDNGGPFTAWLSNTTSTAATYAGAVGHAYSFYTIASDLTGNVEGTKTSAEATTTVAGVGGCGPPSVGAQILSTSHSGTTVTVNLQLTNTGFTAAQAVNINQLTARTLSGSGTVTLADPTLPVAVGPLGVGASTTVTLTLNVPTTVARLSLTENGNLVDSASKSYSYSIAQMIIP